MLEHRLKCYVQDVEYGFEEIRDGKPVAVIVCNGVKTDLAAPKPLRAVTPEKVENENANVS